MATEPLRERLRPWFEDPDSAAGRRTSWLIQIFIFLSIAVMVFDAFPEYSEPWQDLVDLLERFFVTFFTLEYVLRLWVARRRLEFALSFFGIVDFLAVAPYWLAGTDMRSLRVLRFIRLVRILKLARYSRALDRFSLAWDLVHREILMFLSVAGGLLLAAALAIWQFEHEAQPDGFGNLADALWWAVVTLTTVGYGDLYPVTTGGRIFTMLVLLLALGLVAVPSGLVASAFQEVLRRERVERKDGGGGGHVPH